MCVNVQVYECSVRNERRRREVDGVKEEGKDGGGGKEEGRR